MSDLLDHCGTDRCVCHGLLLFILVLMVDSDAGQRSNLVAGRQRDPEARCVPHMVAPAVARVANIGRSGVTVSIEMDGGSKLVHVSWRRIELCIERGSETADNKDVA